MTALRAQRAAVSVALGIALCCVSWLVPSSAWAQQIGEHYLVATCPGDDLLAPPGMDPADFHQNLTFDYVVLLENPSTASSAWSSIHVVLDHPSWMTLLDQWTIDPTTGTVQECDDSGWTCVEVDNSVFFNKSGDWPADSKVRLLMRFVVSQPLAAGIWQSQLSITLTDSGGVINQPITEEVVHPLLARPYQQVVYSPAQPIVTADPDTPVTLAGAADFAFLSSCGQPLSIAVGTISFTPTDSCLDNDNGTVTVSSNSDCVGRDYVLTPTIDGVRVDSGQVTLRVPDPSVVELLERISWDVNPATGYEVRVGHTTRATVLGTSNEGHAWTFSPAQLAALTVSAEPTGIAGVQPLSPLDATAPTWILVGQEAALSPGSLRAHIDWLADPNDPQSAIADVTVPLVVTEETRPPDRSLRFVPGEVSLSIGTSGEASLVLVEQGSEAPLPPAGPDDLIELTHGDGLRVEQSWDRLVIVGLEPGAHEISAVWRSGPDAVASQVPLRVVVADTLPLRISVRTDATRYAPGDRVQLHVEAETTQPLSGALHLGLLDGADARFRSAAITSQPGGGWCVASGQGEGEGPQCALPLEQSQGKIVSTISGLIPAGAPPGARDLQVAAVWLRAPGEQQQSLALRPLLDAGRGQVASAQITVVEDPLFTRATLLGRVYEDVDHSGGFNAGDVPVARAEVLTSRGQVLVADQAGRFHLDQLDPGEIALKAARATVPFRVGEDAEQARVAHLSPGGVTRLDLALQPVPVEELLRWSVHPQGLRPEPMLHLAFDLEIDASAEVSIEQTGVPDEGGLRRVTVPVIPDGQRRASLLLLRGADGTCGVVLLDASAVRERGWIWAASAPVETVATISLPPNFNPINRDLGQLVVEKRAELELEVLGTRLARGTTKGEVQVDRDVSSLDVTVTLQDGRRAHGRLPVSTAAVGSSAVALLDLTAGYDLEAAGPFGSAAADGFGRGRDRLGEIELTYAGGLHVPRLATSRLEDALWFWRPSDRFDALRFPDPNLRAPTFGDHAVVRELNPARLPLYGGLGARGLFLDDDRLLLRAAAEQVQLGETGVGRYHDTGVGLRLAYELAPPERQAAPEVDLGLAREQGEPLSQWDRPAPADEQRRGVAEGAELFALAGAAEHAVDRFVPTAGSFYQLRHADVLPGSEEVTLETVDPVTGVSLSNRRLARGSDYELDALSGRLILASPVALSVDGTRRGQGGFSEVGQAVVVRYAYRHDLALAPSSAGGRVAKRLGPITAELGGAARTPESPHGLVRAGLGLDLRHWLEGELSAAVSAGTGVDDAFSSDGGLSFARTHAGMNGAEAEVGDPAGAVAASLRSRVGPLRLRLESRLRQRGYADDEGSAIDDDSLTRIDAEARFRTGTFSGATLAWLDGAARAPGAMFEREGRLLHGGGAVQRVEQRLGRALVGQRLPLGFILSGGAEVSDAEDDHQRGQRSDLLLRLDHEIARWLATYASGRYAVVTRGAALDDSAVVLGARLGRSGDHALISEIGHGADGLQGRLGVELPADNGRAQVGLRASEQRGSEVAVGGSQHHAAGELYGEERRGLGAQVGQLTRVVGSRVDVTRGLALAGRYEHQRYTGQRSYVADRLLLSPGGGEPFERHAGAAGVHVNRWGLLARLEGEARRDRRDQQSGSFVGVKVDASYELQSALFARLRWREQAALDAETLWDGAPLSQRQVGLGLAFRPESPSVFAGMLRYAHVDERLRRADGEATAAIESASLMLDSPALGGLGAALGMGTRVVFLDGDGLDSEVSYAALLVPRLDLRPGWVFGWGWLRPLDLSAETSLFFADALSPDIGGRVEVAWRFARWLRFGVGYAVDAVALDDLETPTSEIEAAGGRWGERGVFVRLQGIY